MTLSELSDFTGTEQWYRHPVVKNTLYTDGIKYMITKAGAYWLLDEIAFQQFHPRVKKEAFQVWTLRVDLEECTATLTCDDGNDRALFTKMISY